MATWYLRPLPAGGWQVLTPGYTQACAVRPDQDAAIRAACTRIADEGGGQVAVQTASGQLDELIDIAASYSPTTPDSAPRAEHRCDPLGASPHEGRAAR